MQIDASASAAHSASQSGIRILLLLAMALPMLVLYGLGVLGPQIMHAWGLSATAFSWLNVISFACAALLSPFAGQLCHSQGARRTLLLLCAALGAGFGALAFSHSFAACLLALACCGVAQALCNPATNLLIAQTWPAPQRAAIIGFKQSGVQVAALCAGLLMPALAQWLGWRNAFACLLAPLVWLAWRSLRLPAQAPASWRHALQAPAAPTALLRQLMLAQCACGLLLALFVTQMPRMAQAQGIPAQTAGQILAVFAVAGMAGRNYLPRFAPHAGATLRLLRWLLAPAALACLLLAAPGGAWLALCGAALLLGASAVASNSLTLALSLQAPQLGAPAHCAGWLSAAFFSGFALGPPAAAAALEQGLSWPLLWLTLLAPLLCSAFILRRLRPVFIQAK